MKDNFNEVDSGIPVTQAAQRAQELSKGSWERGTCTEALLELYNPELCIFAPDPFPNGRLPLVENVSEVPGLQYAMQYIRTDSNTLQIDDLVVADPASIGVAAHMIGNVILEYKEAANKQGKYLLEAAPRFYNGAISHRSDVVELWADFMYMVPPFLAYHAVAADSIDILRAAIQQCKLYREVLITKTSGNASGLWRHIVGPKHEDLGFWSTSNGWAAAGMARVLATVLKWPKSQGWHDEVQILTHCIKEIIDGAVRTDNDMSTGLLRNYLDDKTWWGEISGTAILVSVVFRMALLAPDRFGRDYLEWAECKMQAVAKHVDKGTGLGAPAVNPLSHLQREKVYTGSPEGQSFLVLLHAAYRDWINSRR